MLCRFVHKDGYVESVEADPSQTFIQRYYTNDSWNVSDTLPSIDDFVVTVKTFGKVCYSDGSFEYTER